MAMSRVVRTALIVLAALFVVPAAALGDSVDPLGFRFASPTFVANSSTGEATITVTRINTEDPAQVRYITTPGTAIPGGDYTAVKDRLDFAAGQASATFTVPLHQSGVAGARTVNLGLFGASPIGLGLPSNAVLTVIDPTPAVIARNPYNPLALSIAPPITDPLTGAIGFVDRQWGDAARQARYWGGTRSREASMLDVIAREPLVDRFGNWTTDPQTGVAKFLARARAQGPGTVPELSTYYLHDSHYSHAPCGQQTDPSWRPATYHRWINSFAQGIGQYRAIVYLEMDAVLITGCLSHHGLDQRLAELRDAATVLSKLPRVVVYMDAGAADGLSAQRTAWLLNHAGVSQIQGFFLNSTHFDWTSREIKYGEQISRLTGGKHFVVSTSANGQGPLVPRNRAKYGNEVLCNPPGRGLGPLPTFNTGYPNVDAFAWIGQPGRSGGTCNGGPPTGVWSPKIALSLVQHADFRVR
jgi:endoglucanase